MEQLFLLIQQIYRDLNILSNYSPEEREELLVGYLRFLLETKELLRTLDRIVGGVHIGVGRLSGDVSHGT